MDEDTSVEVRYRVGRPILEEVRREIASVDRNLPIFRATTLDGQTQILLLRERLLATLTGFFSALALLLACVGVACRTGEIGVRIALGAPRGRIMWLVLREVLILALAGVAIGVPLAIASTMGSNLYENTPFRSEFRRPCNDRFCDRCIAVLAGVAVLAGYLPARRASRVNPMVALRYE